MSADRPAPEDSATVLVDQVDAIVASLTARNVELEMQLAKVGARQQLITIGMACMSEQAPEAPRCQRSMCVASPLPA